MAKSILGWVRQRWTMELEPVLRTATVALEAALRALWERELAWWKTNRGLDGDSLLWLKWHPCHMGGNAKESLPVRQGVVD